MSAASSNKLKGGRIYYILLEINKRKCSYNFSHILRYQPGYDYKDYFLPRTQIRIYTQLLETYWTDGSTPEWNTASLQCSEKKLSTLRATNW
jgi:hypothetical protein